MWGLLFTLISLVYTVQAVRVAYTLVRTWRQFWDDNFTPEEQRLAQQVGFFLIIPFGVLLHEFGHAVATWMVGGQVAKLRWFLFWGYVVPVGHFTPAQDWWIALSGNLVSVLFGFALLALGYWGRGWRRVLRYVLLDTGYFQTMYALVGYPLLSFIGFVGDWVIIYDFKRTPTLSALTGIVHLVVLLAVWAWWRSPRVRYLRYTLVTGKGNDVQALQQRIASQPDDVQAYVELAETFLAHGEDSLAEQTVQEAVRRGLTHPLLDLVLGRTALARGNVVRAIEAFHQALEGGLPAEREAEAWATLGTLLVHEGKHREALEAFSHVSGPLANSPNVLYYRALARRAVGDTLGAVEDLRRVQALILDPGNSLVQKAGMLLDELEKS